MLLLQNTEQIDPESSKISVLLYLLSLNNFQIVLVASRTGKLVSRNHRYYYYVAWFLPLLLYSSTTVVA